MSSVWQVRSNLSWSSLLAARLASLGDRPQALKHGALESPRRGLQVNRSQVVHQADRPSGSTPKLCESLIQYVTRINYSIMECFDPESGQVYRETTVKPRQEPFKEWHHRCAGPNIQNALSPQGADSLMAMTLRILSRKSGQLTSETLAALPARIIRQIFTAIRRR